MRKYWLLLVVLAVVLCGCDKGKQPSTVSTIKLAVDSSKWTPTGVPTLEPDWHEARFVDASKNTMRVSVFSFPAKSDDTKEVIRSTEEIFLLSKSNGKPIQSWVVDGVTVDAAEVPAGFTKGKIKVFARISGRANQAQVEIEGKDMATGVLESIGRPELEKFVLANLALFK